MTKKKRADGEGSIRKRPNGTWEARLSIPGQYKTKSFYGKTQAEARRKRAEAEKALEDGHPLDSQKQTVGEYLEGWLEGPLKTSVAPKTYADYAWICRKYLIPEIGRHKLAKLTAEDLDRLYARKTGSGLGSRTVGYIHSTIRVALQRAVKKRLIPYNVARDAEPPAQRPQEGEDHPLPRTGRRLLQEAAAEAESRFEALFIVAVLAGPVPASSSASSGTISCSPMSPKFRARPASAAPSLWCGAHRTSATPPRPARADPSTFSPKPSRPSRPTVSDTSKSVCATPRSGTPRGKPSPVTRTSSSRRWAAALWTATTLPRGTSSRSSSASASPTSAFTTSATPSRRSGWSPASIRRSCRRSSATPEYQ